MQQPAARYFPGATYENDDEDYMDTVLSCIDKTGYKDSKEEEPAASRLNPDAKEFTPTASTDDAGDNGIATTPTPSSNGDDTNTENVLRRTDTSMITFYDIIAPLKIDTVLTNAAPAVTRMRDALQAALAAETKAGTITFPFDMWAVEGARLKTLDVWEGPVEDTKDGQLDCKAAAESIRMILATRKSLSVVVTPSITASLTRQQVPGSTPSVTVSVVYVASAE